MKQVLIKQGKAVVEDAPAPAPGPNFVLVENLYSFISTGTEMASIGGTAQSPFLRVFKDPALIARGFRAVQTMGLRKTFAMAKGEGEMGFPTGYSCSGIVKEVGSEIKNIKPGMKVACAGAGYANHAEVVAVPGNLVVPVPDGLDPAPASSVAVGAIALQGVRQANPQVGETFLVIGLGLIGQITCQMLKAAGCRVIGTDLNELRVDIAEESGAEIGLKITEHDVLRSIMNRTGGRGVDGVIITAAAKSEYPVQLAMESCRRKGRVVIVGDVKILVKREHFYRKEIDLKISCSYGPGRYDSDYEEKGRDYPFGYVRWTEGRNMEEYLMMLKEKKVNLDTLELKAFPVECASEAYESLKAPAFRPFGAYIEYKKEDDAGKIKEKFKTVVEIAAPEIKVKDHPIRVAVVGAGSFAKSIHLPNIKEMSDLYRVYAVVDINGGLAREVAKQQKAVKAASSIDELLDDPDLDMVLISTRHDTHAELSVKAIKAGKAVFVEKPMALNRKEVEEITAALKEKPVPYMVGFNRRFSPTSARAKEILKNRKSPLIILYRVMSGYIPPDNWLQTELGGGRMIGEGCHMLDMFNFLVGNTDIKEIRSLAVPVGDSGIIHPDNVSAGILYGDGSLCTLLYISSGGKDLPKEYIEMHCESRTLILDDFKSLRVIGGGGGISGKMTRKGHKEELAAFGKYIKGQGPAPLTIDEIITATKTSFIIDEQASES
ncbi:MAG: bi-domain-containing oxidoreductase [Chloroflexi bacterium]|nr:bi-domain-containing oxidoreductase [Chloroflexota bacterium]